MDPQREFLRHTLATVAYRGAKAVRNAPPEFADFKPSPTSRTPREIMAHIGDLMDWGLSMACGKPAWNNATPQAWPDEIRRFHSSMKAFDHYLASDQPLSYSVERLFQGPIADALSHVGQINTLRRIFGVPVKGESYNRAEIQAGRVGPDQTAPDPKYEFD